MLFNIIHHQHSNYSYFMQYIFRRAEIILLGSIKYVVDFFSFNFVCMFLQLIISMKAMRTKLRHPLYCVSSEVPYVYCVKRLRIFFTKRFI